MMDIIFVEPEETDQTVQMRRLHLKFKYRNREFWCRGYYVDTVGKNTAKIQDYIKHQLEEDKMGEQLSIPYPGSPFTGRK
ncbi:TPA: transposase, partial [Escherichia coli]